jgi:hypothetical protein
MSVKHDSVATMTPRQTIAIICGAALLVIASYSAGIIEYSTRYDSPDLFDAALATTTSGVIFLSGFVDLIIFAVLLCPIFGTTLAFWTETTGCSTWFYAAVGVCVTGWATYAYLKVSKPTVVFVCLLLSLLSLLLSYFVRGGKFVSASLVFAGAFLFWTLGSAGLRAERQQQQYIPTERLFFAPDAKESIMAMGVPLQDGVPSLQGVVASQPVAVLLRTQDSYYVQLPDKTVVRLRADKVWGGVILKK